MQIRDRIKALRRVPARELRPNPKNWRTHPPAQRDALRGLLAEIGYAGALLARELDDGSLELIDGHLRAETTPDMEVPVLVLDVTPDEADKLLATFDTVAQLAGADPEAIQSLMSGLEVHHEAVRKLVAQLASDPPGATGSASAEAEQSSHTNGTAGTGKASGTQKASSIHIPQLFQIVVECDGESSQRTLYERLTSEGYECRVLTL